MIAGRVSASVARANVEGVTASVGATVTERRDLEVEAVDAAMYAAKRAGGDRVAFVEVPTSKVR